MGLAVGEAVHWTVRRDGRASFNDRRGRQCMGAGGKFLIFVLGKQGPAVREGRSGGTPLCGEGEKRERKRERGIHLQPAIRGRRPRRREPSGSRRTRPGRDGRECGSSMMEMRN